MEIKQIQQSPQQVYALVFDKEDEFMTQLRAIVEENNLIGGHFTAIGAFREATLGYFDRTIMDYKEIPVPEQVEVLSLIGNIADDNGKAKIHAHVVLGKVDGTTVGGHILQATVWPTLELVLEKSAVHLRRKSDPQTGLALLDLEKEHA